jgi:PAS domain S-box-containing protein
MFECVTVMSRFWSRLTGSEWRPAGAAAVTLCERNTQLDAALNNMSQGLCMFDADERVVVFNSRFLEMYGLSPALVRPGLTLIELLRHRREAGVLLTDPDEIHAALRRDLAKGHTTELLHETRDGRFILAQNRPMPGGGWITTHEDVTDRRKAEEALREQQLQMDAALNNMSQGLCMFDAEQRLILHNRRYLEMYGLTEAEVRPGMTLLELMQLRKSKGCFKGEPREYIKQIEEAVAKRQAVHFTIDTADGRTFEVINTPMADGRWIATHEDVTEKRRAGEMLREQKLQLDTALNNMSQGLCMFDGHARLMFCNRRYMQMYRLADSDVWPGMTLVELLEKRRTMGTWSRDPVIYVAELRAALAKGEIVTFTVEDPAGRTISIFNRPMPDGRWVSCHEDITERCKAEREVLEQKQRLYAAINNMSQGLCMFDADGRLVLFNPRYAEMMQLPPETLPGSTLADILARRRAMGEFFENPSEFADSIRVLVREGKGHSKIVERSDGRVHHVVVRPMPGGGWVTTLEDITERRMAQERLREEKIKLDVALNNMSHGLCMFDAQGRIVLFNPRYAEIVGFPPESLQGLSFEDLLRHRKVKGDFDDDPKAFTAKVFAAVAQGKTITKIAPVRSGRRHRVVVQPLESGGWVTTIEDITEQLRAEEQLRNQKVQLDTALNNMSQGLNMFDSEGRLVVCNERYREMYRLTPEDVKPGRTMRELVEARIVNGSFFSIDPDGYTASLLKSMETREPNHPGRKRLGGDARRHHRAPPRRAGARPQPPVRQHCDRERARDHRREGRPHAALRHGQPRR